MRLASICARLIAKSELSVVAATLVPVDSASAILLELTSPSFVSLSSCKCFLTKVLFYTLQICRSQNFKKVLLQIKEVFHGSHSTSLNKNDL